MVKRRKAAHGLPSHHVAILTLTMFIVLCFGILAFHIPLHSTGKAGSGTTTIGPTNAPTASPGDIVQVKILVSNVEDLQGFVLSFSYNPYVLEFQSAELGPLLQDPPSQLFFDPPDNSMPGTLQYIDGGRQDSTGVSGTGALLVLTFTALDVGTSDFTIKPVSLLDTAFTIIPTTVLGGHIAVISRQTCIDQDNDGFGQGCDAGADCDDAHANIYPGAVEICGNGIDEDCDGHDFVCPQSNSSMTNTTNQNQSLTNQSNQSSGSEGTPDIGLYADPLSPALSTSTVNVTYNVTNTTLLSSCALWLNNHLTQTDAGFTKRFSVALPTLGPYTWKIVCTTVAGASVESPVNSLTRIRMDKFRGATTDVRSIANLASVPNFRLEQSDMGTVEFTRPIDLRAVTDLDAAITFTSTSITINHALVPGMDQPAVVTLPNVRFEKPRILRDGTLCNPPSCIIRSYLSPVLTFAVPGFSTYRIEETPPTSNGSASCTFSLSHGSAELTLSKDSVLCLLVRSTPMRFRAVRISPTNVILMEEVPQQQTLLLSQGTSLPIAFDSAGEPGVTLAFLKAEGGTATISAVFPQKISILKTSIAVAPEPVIPEPSSVPPPIVVPSSPKLEVTAAPLTEHPAPPPRGFQIPYFWIGLSLIAIIIGIVLSAAVAHRKHPELRGPDHLLNPKLAAELQNFGIRPEDAAKRIAEKERRK